MLTVDGRHQFKNGDSVQTADGELWVYSGQVGKLLAVFGRGEWHYVTFDEEDDVKPSRALRMAT